MLTTCFPPLSANSTSGPLRLLQKQRRERERATTESRTPPFGCTKTLKRRENLYQLGSPQDLFLCTHLHTSFHTKPCLNDSYLFWTTKLLLEQWREKKVRETISDLLSMTNSTELLKGIRMSKVQLEQKKLFKKWIKDCRRRSFFKMVWGQLQRDLKHKWTNSSRENLSRECDIFRTQIGFDLGWPSLARSACPFPGDTVAKESHSNGLQGVLPVIP